MIFFDINNKIVYHITSNIRYWWFYFSF